MKSANRNAGTSSARRRSAYLDTVKSTVHTVPLRLFHLFHNTTSYCEAALIQSGKNILLCTLMIFFLCPEK